MNFDLHRLLPRASKSFHAANPQLSPATVNKTSVQGIVERISPYSKKMLMNKTESEFAHRLEIMKRNAEIFRYEYEGITLRWADMKYTPDFIVFYHGKGEKSRIKLIEVKGGHIWDRDIVRFKGARAYWPEFAFEMHQKTKNGWVRKF